MPIASLTAAALASLYDVGKAGQAVMLIASLAVTALFLACWISNH